jgi:class 3 adenylate cyclase/DNA-binding XRE family transcriptional regulator
MAIPSVPTFGDLVRHYRLTSGLTPEQLAQEAGITSEALSMLEAGTSLPPRRETVERLADALHLKGPERSIFLAAGRLPALNQLPAFLSPPTEKLPNIPGRAQPAEPMPSILVFLLADVRGYTRFTVEHGDEAAAKLASRFAMLVREVVTLRGGRLIELRGDEALTCFSSVRQAFQAAVEMQEHFAQATKADQKLPLHVGIGIDAGEAVPVEDGYRGAALNLAARLCSLAGPGEILVSEVVVHLARRVDGLAYRPWGIAELKGFDEPMRVISVQRASLDDEPVPQPVIESERRPGKAPTTRHLAERVRDEEMSS